MRRAAVVSWHWTNCTGRTAPEQASNGAGRVAPSDPTLIPRGGLGTGNVAASAAPGHRHLDKAPDGGLADERLQYLRAAVKSLPERMRYVVEEIYFGDRTVKDLAAELGSTHAAVSQ